MIDFDFSEHCCGCGACADACNQHCISMINNCHGFRIPHVDAKKCVNCGMCDKICPVLNVHIRNNPSQKCFCTYYLNEEIRNAGSSGSMFYLIAEWMIAKGGIVIGAAFDNNLYLRHTIATTISELRPLLKSKYLQSDTTGIFMQVRDFLRMGRKVLFVGTPCQCQALYNFVGYKKTDSLFLIDFICHGVPSQDLFNRFVKHIETKKKVKVKSFVFREKNNPKSPKNEDDIHNYTIVTCNNSNGQVSIKTGFYKDCSFYSGFKKYQIFRNSCYECKFIGCNRITDFTLGDFWHLTEYEPEIRDFHKGYSELIINSERGNKLFEELKDKVYYKEYSMNIPMKRNSAYSKHTVKHFDRDLFFLLYKLPYSILSIFFSHSLLVRGPIYILRKIFG